MPSNEVPFLLCLFTLLSPFFCSDFLFRDLWPTHCPSSSKVLCINRISALRFRISSPGSASPPLYLALPSIPQRLRRIEPFFHHVSASLPEPARSFRDFCPLCPAGFVVPSSQSPAPNDVADLLPFCPNDPPPLTLSPSFRSPRCSRLLGSSFRLALSGWRRGESV